MIAEVGLDPEIRIGYLSGSVMELYGFWSTFLEHDWSEDIHIKYTKEDIQELKNLIKLVLPKTGLVFYFAPKDTEYEPMFTALKQLGFNIRKTYVNKTTGNLIYCAYKHFGDIRKYKMTPLGEPHCCGVYFKTPVGCSSDPRSICVKISKNFKVSFSEN